MSLIKYLLTEGKKDVIVDKIGLPPKVADYCIKYFNKKFVLYWATAIQNSSNANAFKSHKLTYDRFINWGVPQLFKQLEDYIRTPELPQLPKDLLNKFKEQKDQIDRVRKYINAYQTILDYAEATNRNFQNDDFMETFQEAEHWHENLKSSGKTIELEGDMELIHEFDDGYYWVDNHSSNCQVEGDAMGHCGNTNADTILSLRSPDGEPHISVAFDYDGTYRQAKGKQNKKPVEKYHKYMYWLFDNDEYQIKRYQAEYQQGEDFKVEDLPEELREEVLEKYPSIDPTYAIRSIIDNETLSEQQKFDAFVELDEEQEIFEGEFESELEFDPTDDMVIVQKDVDPRDYAKEHDRVFEWSMDVLNHTQFLDFDVVDAFPYLDDIDTDRFPYESDEMQELLNHAKHEDDDLYHEYVEEFLDYEGADEPFEEFVKDGDELIEFVKFLYEKEKFDEFQMVLERVTRWAFESTAYDEIYKDTIDFIKSAPMENGHGGELEWEFDYDRDYELISDEGEVNVKLALREIVNVVLEDPDFFDRNYLSDIVRPFNFTAEMVQPHYGYPKGTIDSEVFNDSFSDGVYN